MNTIIKYILVLLLLLSVSSCLDEHPKDQVNQDAIYNNADNIYKNAVASLYNYIGSNQESEGLQGTCRGIYDYNTITTDEAMIPIRGGDWYDGGLWENMYKHKWNANDIYLYNVWKYLYKVIVLSNQSLSIIDSHKHLLSTKQIIEYKAEVRARTTGNVFSKGNLESSEEHTELEPKDNVKLSIWNAIIPIGVLIVGAIIGFYLNGKSIVMAGEDAAAIEILKNSPMSLRSIQTYFGKADASIVLFQSALLASIVAIVMAATKKIFTVSEAIETWIEGMKPLIITSVILVLAWSLTGVIKDLGTGAYLVSILSDKIPAFILPSIIFILGAVISFATGTAYGTMGILMPLAIPLAFSIGGGSMNLVIVSASAVLTGAVFGDHSSPISDTTILSSTGSGCNHIEHVRTQMPSALLVAAVSILAGYIPAALGVSIWIVLPVSIVLVGAIVYIVGKPVPNTKNM